MVDPSELWRRLEENEPLVRIADERLDWITAMTGPVEHAVCLADADGVVLSTRASAESIAELYDVEPGRIWSEEVMGTNGVGTALQDGQPG